MRDLDCPDNQPAGEEIEEPVVVEETSASENNDDGDGEQGPTNEGPSGE